VTNYDAFATARPIAEESTTGYCGDKVLIDESEEIIFLSLFDTSGHGLKAHVEGGQAIRFISENKDEPLIEIIKQLDIELKGKRGGVGVVAKIDKQSGLTELVGLGNVRALILLPKQETLIIRGGVIGFEIQQPILNEFILKPGMCVAFFSDGVTYSTRTDKVQLSENMSAEEIATYLMTHYADDEDDASIVVFKAS